MKKIILFSLILIGCQKKSTAPSSTAQTTQDVKTFCWYQVFNGSKLFYKCTTNQSEYNETSIYCSTHQMNMSVKESINCNCQ